MTVSFAFAPEFLDQEGIPLSVHDLKYGVERGWLRAPAVYDRRQDLEDPLSVVEQIYTDFDYPPAVASFVRYMPLGPGVPRGGGSL